MNILTAQQTTITVKIVSLQDLPRKKKKAIKKAMRIEWSENPIDVSYLMKQTKP